jgi:hypothetical protein
MTWKSDPFQYIHHIVNDPVNLHQLSPTSVMFMFHGLNSLNNSLLHS